MTDWTSADAYIPKKYKKAYEALNEIPETIYKITQHGFKPVKKITKKPKTVDKSATKKPSLMDRTLKDKAWHGGPKTKTKDKTTKKQESTMWGKGPVTPEDQIKAGKGNIVSIKNTKDTNSLKLETPDLKIVKTTPKPQSKAGRPKKVDPNANPVTEGLLGKFTSPKVLAGREKRAAQKKATGNIYGHPLKKDVVTVKGGGAKRGDIANGRPSTDMQRYDPETGKPLREGLTIGRGTKPKPIAGQPKKRRNR